MIKLRKIKPSERKEIKKILRRKNNNKIAERARIIKLVGSGYSMRKVAKILDIDSRTVSHWIKQFNEKSIQGLYDKPRLGRPEKKVFFSEKVLSNKVRYNYNILQINILSIFQSLKRLFKKWQDKDRVSLRWN